MRFESRGARGIAKNPRPRGGWDELRMGILQERQACTSYKSIENIRCVLRCQWSLPPRSRLATDRICGRMHLRTRAWRDTLLCGSFPDLGCPNSCIIREQSRAAQTWSVSLNVLEPQPQSLGFMQMKDWNSNAAYDEKPPTYIHYRIGWRLMINKATDLGIVVMELPRSKTADPRRHPSLRDMAARSCRQNKVRNYVDRSSPIRN